MQGVRPLNADDYAFQRNERGVSARPFVVPCVILFVSFVFASRAHSSLVQETRPLNAADDYAFQRNARGISARPFVVPCVILFVSLVFASRAHSSLVQETRPLNAAGSAKIILKVAETTASLCAGDKGGGPDPPTPLES